MPTMPLFEVIAERDHGEPESLPDYQLELALDQKTTTQTRRPRVLARATEVSKPEG
jgi:hypothetical protein